MDFTTRKTRERIVPYEENDDWENVYTQNVTLYHIPPTEDISLQTFEELAIERLNVLRILDQAANKSLRIMSDEWRDTIIADLNQAGLKNYVRLIEGRADATARRRDYISHFILRLAYCRTQDLKRWFLQREMDLFKLKFRGLSPADVKKFLELSNLDYSPISEEEILENNEGLHDSTIASSLIEHNFYKVNFTEVPDLISKRRCFVRGGYAYVRTQDFISIVAGQHEQCIENGLKATSRVIPELETDERLVNFLKNLNTSYTGKDYSLTNKDTVPIECIDQLSKKSFPMCMRQCHEALRSKHHLKHHARVQYGLFLKGIGVTLEDSLRFWREEFTKMMDLDKFDRQYAYNIRYNYGKEGSQTNWTPASCLKIISAGGNSQEAYGCPFKTYDTISLKAKLTAYGFSTAHTQEVATMAAKGHYQLACVKYFDIMHDIKIEGGINHPNQYFDKSQAIIEDRVHEGKTNTKQGKSGEQKEVLVKKAKESLLDEYDDELWNVTQRVESEQNTQLSRMAWDNDEDDQTFSQIDDIY